MSDGKQGGIGGQIGKWIDRIVLVIALLLVAMLFLPCNFIRVGAPRESKYARSDLAMICTALNNYVASYGSAPSGNNAQIMAVLRGANPKEIIFLEAKAKSLNANGDFIDPWGTPYFLDTSNPEYPCGYSFGKDKKDGGGAPGTDDIPSWR